MTIEAHLERVVIAGELDGLGALADEQWEELVDLVAAEGLEGLLYHRCTSDGVDLPAEVHYAWRTGYWGWATDNFAALQALKPVLAELGRRGVEVLVLPGAPLLALYPDPGCRPMEDIDLLVRPEQVPAVTAALVELGFESPERYADLFARGSLLIDLHDDLFHCGRIAARRHAGRLDIDRVWGGRRTLEVEGVEMCTPRLEDMALYTAVHALRHSYRRLSWFGDLRLLLDADLDWDYLLDGARAGGLERPLAYALRFLVRSVPLPPPLAAWLERREWSGFEAWLLQRAFSDRRGELGDLLWSLNIESRYKRLQFLAQTYFPQPAVMLQVFPFLPKPLFPLAYGLRLGQLVLRGGRQLAGLVRKT